MLAKLRSESLSRRNQFILLSFMPLYFIVVGLFLQPINTILPGIWTLMIEPDFLITDYFVVGGIGSAFINAGLLTLLCIGFAYFSDLAMEGHTITASYLMFGFALFGKNLMNVWAILGGVVLYSLYHKTSITRYLYVGMNGTALSPIITQIIHFDCLPTPVRLLMGVVIGVIMGFVLPPLSTHVSYAHKGYSLYNVGFACGIIATVVVSVLKSFGVEVGFRTFWYRGGNDFLCAILCVFFLGLMLIAVVIEGKGAFKGYWHILKSPGIGDTDFVKEVGVFPVAFNMGINGLFSTIFLLLVGGDLNGPTIGGIMTIVGFGSTGKHIRNSLPVMLGVFLASIVKTWNITDPSPTLAFLFCTTLAPVAGKFGVFAGILAGFLHSSVVMTVGVVYAGMNLYNNGFAGGIVAIFLVPVLQSITDRRARAKGHRSL